MRTLTGRHHAVVARCRQLARGRSATDQALLLDGPHLLEEACDAGLSIEVVAATRAALAREPRLAARLAALETTGTAVYLVDGAVGEALSPVRAPSGVIALAAPPKAHWDALLGPGVPLVLVVVNVQDPGNVGAVIRAADAAGATGVVVTGTSADPFGWKALRGAMGSSLRLPVRHEADPAAVAHRLVSSGVPLLATAPRGAASIYDTVLTGPAAILLGGEGAGLDPGLVALAPTRLTIPMRAPVESLNVAVAAALIAYEARRQRHAGHQE